MCAPAGAVAASPGSKSLTPRAKSSDGLPEREGGGESAAASCLGVGVVQGVVLGNGGSTRARYKANVRVRA